MTVAQGSVSVPGMPRPATGVIEAHTHADGRTITYRLRVSAYGQRHRLTLGTNLQGWGPERAELEREKIAGQIERGTWEPPEAKAAASPARVEGETVHRFMSTWWNAKKLELEPTTIADYEFRMKHILRHLHSDPVESLEVRAIDAFRDELRARGLSARYVNMILDLLAQVLDVAVEYEILPANPARGKRRRLKVEKPSRSFLEADMVESLLDAAGAWEKALPPHQRYGQRAVLAALILSGPRISELLVTPLGSVDLHGARIRLGLKTAAGRDRDLELSAFLLGEIRAHVAGIPGHLRAPTLPLFHSRTGQALNASNIRNRLLARTVEKANEQRAADGRMLIPRLTPHSLRRTFASLCFFAGRDLRWVMRQLGHDDPRMTLAVYAQTMARSRVDEAIVWRLMHWPHEAETAAPRGTIGGPQDRPGGALNAPGHGTGGWSDAGAGYTAPG